MIERKRFEAGVRATNMKMLRQSDPSHVESEGQLFNIYQLDTREKEMSAKWVIMPAMLLEEAINCAGNLAKTTAGNIDHAEAHTDPPCLYPHYLAACVFIIPPDKPCDLITFFLEEVDLA